MASTDVRIKVTDPGLVVNIIEKSLGITSLDPNRQRAVAIILALHAAGYKIMQRNADF